MDSGSGGTTTFQRKSEFDRYTGLGSDLPQTGTDLEADATIAALPESVFAKKTSGASLRLNSIFEVKGIEALNPRAPLTFTHEPLTIVYGGNGAGKSGYIRILNNVCGSKNRRKLFNNVFQEAVAQSCKISYVVNGTAKEITWQPSDGLQPELAALEIYDSECGHVYISAENEVTFEPWLLGLFQRLVDACAVVDKILETEIAALPSKKPDMPVGALRSTRHGRTQALSDRRRGCFWVGN